MIKKNFLRGMVVALARMILAIPGLTYDKAACGAMTFSEPSEIRYDADTNQVKKCLQKQDFVMFEQGGTVNDKQKGKFGNSQFVNFPCSTNLIWHEKHFAEINIESTEKFLLGTNFPYQNLVRRFNDEYGQPSQCEKYMLKIFPGIWVESAKWIVVKRGIPAFTVSVSQSNPVVGPDMGRINIVFQRVAGNIR